ncbi:MAG TPA: type II toxin-antitoxin system VapC family toxin [Rhodoblastus sp.]|nr:type II toxin-antitoxin system VapC family toxin [Rhodoblastus sp.]
MIAIDTNVVIRFLTRDDPVQSRKALALVDGAEVFVSRTVMLECEWVLRSLYGYSPAQVTRALRAFSGLKTVSVEDPAALAQALDLADAGLDFADALHLLAAADCEGLATFDRSFIRAARKAGMASVREV